MYGNGGGSPPNEERTGLLGKIKNWIDSIFSPVHSFLDIAIEKLRAVGQVTAQGLNVSSYLSIFGDMPYTWQLVIQSLLISMALLGTIFIFRSIMRVYFGLKDGVKWW
ncbi:MAG TPA: hypothetical protein GX525_12065 [Bacilli bacterium]|nr:hypothetical protein [Bacilli bacterium]